MSRDHLGKDGLKSGKDVTPGHACSSGVPRSLVVMSKYSCPTAIGGDSPEDFKYLVNLGVAREQRLSRAHLSEDASD